MVSLKRVCPQDVDASGTHLIWAEAPPAAMLASIAEVGQLEPVLARYYDGFWRVVSGYKRVQALTGAGAMILVREIPGQPDPLADGRLYLHANVHRVLDDGLRLKALRYFRAWLAPEDLARQIAPLLDIDTRSSVWKRFMDWLALPKDWDDLLRAGRLPLAAGELLTRLDLTDLAALGPYFENLKWSHSRAVQWLTLLTEASRREKTCLGKVLESNGSSAILVGDLSPQDKLHRLYLQARRLRYPVLTSLEQRFDEVRKELEGKSRWQVIPSQGFESDTVELRLKARGVSDIQAAARDLEGMAVSERLPELFSVAR